MIEVATHRVQLVRSDDLSDLDQLIEVIVTLELIVQTKSKARREEIVSADSSRRRDERVSRTYDHVLPEDHAHHRASQTPHVETVVVLPVVDEQLRSLVVPRCDWTKRNRRVGQRRDGRGGS